MKLSKDDLKKKVSENIKDNDDLVISLLEDIEDSFIDENTEDNSLKEELDAKLSENEGLKAELNDLKLKYKERFLSKPIEEKTPEIDRGEELKEKQVIDIREI